jgi:hypothetical protein
MRRGTAGWPNEPIKEQECSGSMGPASRSQGNRKRRGGGYSTTVPDLRG